MFLYNLTLQKSSEISHVIHGYFSGVNIQELVISRRKNIELLLPDPNTGQLQTLTTIEIYGIIRSLISCRLPGKTKDYVVVCSDCGVITILEYLPSSNEFVIIQSQAIIEDSNYQRCLNYCQNFAVDPVGRPIIFGSIDKQRFSLELNSENNQLTLDVNAKKTLVYYMTGIDAGLNNNSQFACLEIDFTESNPQQLFTVYEFNSHTKQITQKHSEPFENHANILISVPGGETGPSGLLICFEDHIIYKNFNQSDVCCPIPRRRNDLDDLERGMIFICSTTHKTDTIFFFLAQTEQGDIFKITLDVEKGKVVDIRLKYLDTLPLATAMCILQSGLLFIASEFGNHFLYQIAQLGDDDDLEFNSKMSLEDGDTFFFTTRKLRNLILLNKIDSLSPVLSCYVTNVNGEEASQLYMLCGRGPRSSLRILKHGLTISELGVAELPANPIALWTIKQKLDDVFDWCIVLSFSNFTLVLSIGEDGIEEVTNSLFLTNVSTLACGTLNIDSIVQVYSGGIRCIGSDKSLCEWKSTLKTIVKCIMNQRQIVLALTGGELVYFDMDANGLLHEHEFRKRMNSDILCMAMSSTNSGQHKAKFLAVGLIDNTIRILSLDSNDYFVNRFVQQLPACIESVFISKMESAVHEENAENSTMYIHVGLQNGGLYWWEMNSTNGTLSNARSRYLGLKPVKLFRLSVHNSDAILAISNKPWLNYIHKYKFHLVPLSYDFMELASSFSSPQCLEGIIVTASNVLRIISLENICNTFTQNSFPLKYTPRKLIIHPETNNAIIIETEHNTYTHETKKQLRLKMVEEMKEVAGEEEQELAKEMAEAFLNDDLPESIFSSPKAGHGMWASTLRIIEPIYGATHKLIHFKQNEAAMSLCLITFTNQWFLIVGIAKDFQLNTGVCSKSFLDTYKIDNMGIEFELLHRTTCNGVPMALCAYNEGVLAGIGTSLCFYEIEFEKLSCKCENKNLTNAIVNIQTVNKRIFVSDVQESIFLVSYQVSENQFIILAVDSHPRWITCATLLDEDTVTIADKLGNIAVLRVSSSLRDENEDLCKDKLHTERFDTIATFYVGETVTWLQKVTLIAGGWESIIYVTLSGTIGILVPFTTNENKELFENIEIQLRKEVTFGQNHLSYRSYFYPVKNVIDGDLCEQYYVLEPVKQRRIATVLNKKCSEILGKLEEMRKECAP